jgi:hypothetical protein
MWTKNLGKVYPELEGLPPYEQNKILERARHEFTQEGNKLFWGTRFVLFGILIACVCGSILYLISYGNDTIPLIGSLVIVMTYIQIVINRNIKLIQPKVKELVQNNNTI